MSEQQTNIEQTDASAEIARLKAIVDNEIPNSEEIKDEIPVDSKQKDDVVDENEDIENVDENKNPDEFKNEEGQEDSKNLSEDADEQKEPSTEAVIAYLKSQNINIESIEDLRKKVEKPSEISEEDQETFAALKKLEIKKWAIEKKIDPKTLDKFEEDSKLSDTEIAYRVYFEERKNETNPATDEPYTDEELREEFEAENFLNEEDTSLLKKRKLKNISLIAQTYRYENYKDLNNLEKSYDQELFTANEVKILNETIADAKTKIIEQGISYTLKDELGADVIVNIPITKKLLDEIELNQENVEDVSDTDDIASKIKEKYFVKNMGKILHEVATTFHSKQLLDLKSKSIGIESRKSEMGEITPDEIDVKLKKLIEKHTVK